jgi:predicted peroxiredoxin
LKEPETKEDSVAGKVVVNLSRGAEDPEAVTVAFIVADSAVSSGRQVVMFLTRDAVRLAIDGEAGKVAVAGYPPVGKLFAAIAAAGGELHCCTPCFKTRGLDPEALAPNAKVSGATKLLEWMGEDGTAVFSY